MKSSVLRLFALISLIGLLICGLFGHAQAAEKNYTEINSSRLEMSEKNEGTAVVPVKKLEPASDITTFEKYGRGIMYFAFSKIPAGSSQDEKIKLPVDLAEYIDDKYNNLRIENQQRFERDFWEEAAKLEYSAERLKKLNVKDAIMAAVDIVSSRFTYHDVDGKKGKEFIKKYGEHLPTDRYFHLKLGDCDKYRDATIGVFKIIKALNPGLKNI